MDTECLSKAEVKFNAAFAKAELKGGCATTEDAEAIEAIIDDTLAQLLDELPTVPPIEICDNGEDDDGDLLIDRDDDDCSGTSGCPFALVISTDGAGSGFVQCRVNGVGGFGACLAAYPAGDSGHGYGRHVHGYYVGSTRDHHHA